MINLKDKTYTKKKTMSSTIKKQSMVKKIAISSLLLVSAIASWDVAVTASNTSHAKSLADYKYNYYNNLADYNTLKQKIDAVPYTDADFKKDLETFSYIYDKDKGSPQLKKFLKYDNGIALQNILAFKYTLNNPDQVFSKIDNYVKNIPLNKIQDWNNNEEINTNISNMVSQIVNQDRKNSSKLSENKMESATSKFSNNALGNMKVNDKIYNNFSNLLASEGFDKNSYFMSDESAKRYNLLSVYSSYLSIGYVYYTDKSLNDFKEQVSKNNELALKYYHDGDFKKLRELFRLGNGFAHVLIDEPTVKSSETTFGNTFYSDISYQLNLPKGFYDPAKKAEVYAKYTGQLKPEQEQYYEDITTLLNR